MGKYLKKIIVLTLILACTGITNFASPSEWAEDSFFTLEYLGFLDGDLGDMTKLQKNITREEFAELALKMYLKKENKKIENIELGSRFEDTKNPYVGGVYNLGIVNGISKNLFAPESFVTREQIAAMFLRELNVLGVDTTITQTSTYKDYESVSTWAKNGVDFISQEGIMNGIGDNKVAPKENATREQAMALIHKIGVKYKWFGNFKEYADDQYTLKEGFKVPKREITQLSIFSIPDTAYDLNIVLKGYVITGEPLDIETQQIQVYKLLQSNSDISYKAIDNTMDLVKRAWQAYNKSYKLENTKYIDIYTGNITNVEPNTSHIRVYENAVLNINIMIK